MMTEDEQIMLLVQAMRRYRGSFAEFGADAVTLLQQLGISDEDFSGYVESDIPELQAAFVLLHLRSAQKKQELAELLAIADRVRNNRYTGPYAEAESLLDDIKMQSSLTDDFDFDSIHDRRITQKTLRQMIEQHQL